MDGMIGAGDPAIGVLDVTNGDAGLDQGDVDSVLDITRRFFDSDTKVIRGARETTSERLALLIHDECGCFGGATVDAEDIEALGPWLDWAYAEARAA
jgi:hypothetical protein